MKFTRAKTFPGGVLGEHSNLINAIEKSLEAIAAGHGINFIHSNNSITITTYKGSGVGGGSGPHAFKIYAAIDADTKLFSGQVLGGTAQTLGGTPKVYIDTPFTNLNENTYVWLRYRNVDSNYVEIGEWDDDIHFGSLADMAAFTAPQDLIYEIGFISESYSRNVRQDHKGNIVMPAISNVVDVQTELP